MGQFIRLHDQNGVKVGVDDWLAQVGEQWGHLWPKLERVPLDHRKLKGLARWWQGWRAQHADAEAARTGGADDFELDHVGSVLQFRWKRYGVELCVDRVRQSQDRVTAELIPSLTRANRSMPLLCPSVLNLTSARTRKDLARQLSLKVNNLPWPAIIESLCRTTLERIREGEPVQHIAPHLEIESLDHRLDPLVADRRPAVVVAEPGSAKSLFALFSAMIVEVGATIAGLRGTRGRAMYVDYEAEYGDHVHRADGLRAAHADLAEADVLYWRSAGPLSDVAHQLQRLILQHQIKLLVIDSLGLAAGGDLMGPDVPLRFFQALRPLRVASLIVAHPPKNADEKKSVYGSMFFEALARSVFELRKVQEAGSDRLRLGLFHRKENNGALRSPIGFEISFLPGATKVEAFNVEEEPELATNLPLSARLKHALKGGAKTVEDLAEELDVAPATVRARLNDGRGKWATKIDKDRWGLIVHGTT
jgi:hypothetical protein